MEQRLIVRISQEIYAGKIIDGGSGLLKTNYISIPCVPICMAMQRVHVCRPNGPVGTFAWIT